jgi:hypothetical protein
MSTEARAFKWVALAVATVFAAVVLWMLNDMRLEVKRTNDEVAQRLPQILENVQAGTETLATVSKDIDALRDLAGLTDVATDHSLAVYADSILDFLETQTGQIGVEKLIGKGKKDLIPAADWARDSRKEGLWLTVRASTKAELLDRLSATKFGRAWWYVPPGGSPIKLIDFLRQNHPESKSL